MGTLIHALLDSGYEVSAFTTDRDLPLAVDTPVVAAGPRFRIHYLPVRPRSVRFSQGYPGRILDLFRLERRRLAAAMRADDCEVVHAHWSYEFALGALESGKPTVVTCHDSPWRVLRYMPNLYRFGRMLMARSALRRALVVTAVSPHIVRELELMASKPIRVVANPPPLGLEQRARVRSLRTLHADPKFVMVLNGFDRRKNAKPALRAFAALRRRYDRAEMHCYGYGFGPGEQAEAWCRRQGTIEGVHFHGSCSHQQVLEAIDTSDAIVHPALEESCCMAIVEAMTLGVPVIAGRRSGGVPWQLDEGKAGCLVDVASADAIASAMMGLLKSDAGYRAISVASIAQARRLFATEAVVAQYAEAYGQVLALANAERSRVVDGTARLPVAK
jgi:glycosyltransferase involved in cell wall biosynthesis